MGTARIISFRYNFGFYSICEIKREGKPHDFITMSAPSTRVDCGCLTTKAREEGAEHAHYRRGLSPELSANCVFGSGHWGVRRTAIESRRWRSREVLSGPATEMSPGALGDGGHRLFTLVRAVTRGTECRGVDWRCGEDQDEARPQAKDRPPGCPTSVKAAARK